MKEVNSKVETVNLAAAEFLEAVNFLQLKNLLENKVGEREEFQENLLSKIKKLTPNEVVADFGIAEVKIKAVERTAKHVRINLDCAGIKSMNLWVQALPIDENTCKARFRAEYEFSLSPVGLLLRSKVDEENLKEAMDLAIEEIAKYNNN